MKIRWQKRFQSNAGWVGISLMKYQGESCIADPAGLIANGFELNLGLWFGMLNFKSVQVSRAY
jgi:hypothetical protein